MALGRIRTKSVYDPAENSDGIRILVTRYHPRIKGFKKGIGYSEWLMGLSPLGPAVKKFKAGRMTEHEFGKQYLSYLAVSNEARKELARVRELLKNGETVTLLCYEPEGEFCHRHLLKGYLENKHIV
ncbi:MAG TPA: DUF488 domain-containing protein [Nitrososphaera sp.]|jgi:uncharacterized protein YeaO (DUF488 family)|nr:DUF488 domain-containing protein [Nitrososphaera sp.]